MDKSSDKLLLTGGIIAIIFGVALLCYSIKSYAEIKYLENHIDFEELDHNNRIPTSDKYFKHLSIQDYLNQKLNKNKNLPFKNTSCIYLDYAQHNLLSWHRLIFKSSNEDNTKKSVVEGNIRTHLILLDDYKICKMSSQYKSELQTIIDQIEKSDDLEKENRMNNFLNGERIIPKDSEADTDDENNNVIQDDTLQTDTNSENNQKNADQNSENLIQPYLE